MDLFFDASDASAATELRCELAAFFARHAAPESDLAGAELAVCLAALISWWRSQLWLEV